jgi:DNA invertase Pin-like site-specific DNA recombinase
MFRCAIYKRWASTEGRTAALYDQERNCREAIASLGMAVEEQFVVSEAGTSDQPPFHREGLNGLLAAAKQSPRPFEYVVMDDTSRMGRNLGVVAKIYQTFKDHEISLFFASQKLDSTDKNFELMLTIVDTMNEQYVAALSRAVIRGQKRIRKGVDQ